MQKNSNFVFVLPSWVGYINDDTITKLQKISVLPWGPNLSSKSKITRFIWVFIVLGIYDFEASLKSKQTNRKIWPFILTFFQETSTKLHLCSPCSSWCATALSTWLALYRLFWRLQIGGHGLSITIGKWKVVYMCSSLIHVIYLKMKIK